MGNLTNPYIWLTLVVFVGFGFIGFLDDYSKIKGRQNQGLTAESSSYGKLPSASVFMPSYNCTYSTHLALPFMKSYTPDLGFSIFPLLFLFLLGSNGVNLTDGLDGLAIGPSIIATLVFTVFIYIAGHATIANYCSSCCQGVGEVAVLCGAFIAGFLWFNAYRAQVFGRCWLFDIGGTLGFLSVLCKQNYFFLWWVHPLLLGLSLL